MDSRRAATPLGPIVVVRDDRNDARPLASGEFLARHTGASLTVLEVGGRGVTSEAGVLHLAIAGDDAGRSVADHANHRGESLVLLASRGGGPPAGPLFDECAERALECTRRPVLAFGPGAAAITRPPTMVLALDAASSPEPVEATLTTVLTAVGASVVVAELVPVDPWPTDDGDPVADGVRQLASSWRTRMPTRFVQVPTWDPASDLIALVDPMAEVVLVTVAPRWTDPVDHWHATARRLIRHAPCPVLVVPRDACSPYR